MTITEQASPHTKPQKADAPSRVTMLPLSSIRITRNPRRYFDEKLLDELAASIAAVGLIEPLVVRPADDEDNVYDLIAGGRRHRACERAGLAEVPAHVMFVDEKTAWSIAIVENMQREGLSPAEEARAVRDLVDNANGDERAVAHTLVWPVAKVRARLALLHCSEAVLSAIDEKRITAAHGELLSTLPHKAQDSALARIVDQKISWETLKQELQGYAIPLTIAPFDTKQTCAACPHNSAVQMSLFGHELDTARCSNKACFSKLAAEALESRRTALRDEYSTVALTTEKDPTTLIPIVVVGPNGVGEHQLNDGCKACGSFGATIENRLVADLGKITRGVCFDAQGCHREKVAAYQAQLAAEARDRAGQAAIDRHGGSPNGRIPVPVQSSVKGTKPAAKAAPAALTAYADNLYRRIATKVLKADPAASIAVVLLATTKLPSPSGKPRALDGVATKRGPAPTLSVLAAKPLEDLIAVATHAAVACVEAAAHHSNGEYDPVAIAHALVTARSIDLSAEFQVDRAYLEANTVGAIEATLKESGFERWFLAENADGKSAFKKLLTGKKSEIIDAILAAKFDWTGFVPACIKNHRAKAPR